MSDNCANSEPTNTIPSDISSNGTFSEPESSPGGGVLRREILERSAGTEEALDARSFLSRVEGDVIKLSVEQFTAMVGILLSAMGGSGARQMPNSPAPARENRNREREAGGLRGEARGEDRGFRGLERGIGVGENREAMNGEVGGDRGEPWGRMGQREAGQALGELRRGAGIQSAVILEEVYFSMP